jgi:arylsulfatase
VHEGGIASPCVVHWPARIRSGGQVRHTPAHFIDLPPTMLELAGAGAVGAWGGATPPPLPGRSLVPAFDKDAPITRECLYWHHGWNRAIRVGDWKLVSADQQRAYGPWELYDLSHDRAERHDLAAKYPHKVRELAAKWEECEAHFRRQADTDN